MYLSNEKISRVRIFSVFTPINILFNSIFFFAPNLPNSLNYVRLFLQVRSSSFS